MTLRESQREEYERLGARLRGGAPDDSDATQLYWTKTVLPALEALEGDDAVHEVRFSLSEQSQVYRKIRMAARDLPAYAERATQLRRLAPSRSDSGVYDTYWRQNVLPWLAEVSLPHTRPEDARSASSGDNMDITDDAEALLVSKRFSLFGRTKLSASRRKRCLLRPGQVQAFDALQQSLRTRSPTDPDQQRSLWLHTALV
jgi:hypothetical protein